jgi:molybdate transport system ATP-binding protein
MCLSEELHAIVGASVIGSVLEGIAERIDAAERLATIRCDELSLRVALAQVEPGSRVRLYVPADDVLIALEPPRHVSARNILSVEITRQFDRSSWSIWPLPEPRCSHASRTARFASSISRPANVALLS